MNVVLDVRAAVALAACVLGLETGAATQRLPDGYERVEFIRSTGGQYVDAEFVMTPSTKIACDVAVEAEQSADWSGLFGAMPNDNYRNAGTCVFFGTFGSSRGTAGAKAAYSRSGFEATGADFPWGERITLTCSGSEATWRAEGRSGKIVNARCSCDAGRSRFFVFNYNTATNEQDRSVRYDRGSCMRFYGMRVTDGQKAVRDFTPCRAPDGSLGLYDSVTGRFYANLGRGRFLAPGEPPNSIGVQAGAKILAYNPMIFGHFLEQFDNQVYGGVYDPGSRFADEDGFRKDVIEALKAIRAPIVRWPGGCFVSAYHWQDGVGKRREGTWNKAWRVEEPNTFGTDEYVKWCRKVGCEPYICTNAGTGSPEEMSDWVEYCNGTVGRFARMRAANGSPEPFGIKFWSVGNENWGAWEIGGKTSAEWGSFVLESAKMMRATDGRVTLLAAATTEPGWTLPLLRRTGHLIDEVSVHKYDDWSWSKDVPVPNDYIRLMMRTESAEHGIAAMRRIIDSAGCAGRVKVAYDEWNARGWHHPGLGSFHRGNAPDYQARRKNDRASVYTMADAVYTACQLNAFLRNADLVDMACFAPCVNTTGPIFVHKDGIVLRTTYYVFKMYANDLLPYRLPADIVSERLRYGHQSTTMIDAAVTADETRSRYVIAVANKDPERARPVRIDFAAFGAEPCAALSGTVLTGPSPDAYNDIGAKPSVVPAATTFAVRDGVVDLPPHSVCLIRLENSSGTDPKNGDRPR